MYTNRRDVESAGWRFFFSARTSIHHARTARTAGSQQRRTEQLVPPHHLRR